MAMKLMVSATNYKVSQVAGFYNMSNSAQAVFFFAGGS